jgi:hypothetical protein
MTSSPGCWERFGQVLAEQYRPERMSFHQLSVDAYAASHHGDGSPQAIQSVAIHLMTLCLFIERGTDPVHGPKLHRLMVDRPDFAELEVPNFSGRINVADLTLGATDSQAEEEAWKWARDVWDAHTANHEIVRSWLRRLNLLDD